MSGTESQENGSSIENKEPVNSENATEHAETRDESAIEHVRKPYDQGDIIPITEGGWRISKKNTLEDFEIPRKERKTP